MVSVFWVSDRRFRVKSHGSTRFPGFGFGFRVSVSGFGFGFRVWISGPEFSIPEGAFDGAGGLSRRDCGKLPRRPRSQRAHALCTQWRFSLFQKQRKFSQLEKQRKLSQLELTAIESRRSGQATAREARERQQVSSPSTVTRGSTGLLDQEVAVLV